jgi:hypothetical protein
VCVFSSSAYVFFSTTNFARVEHFQRLELPLKGF